MQRINGLTSEVIFDMIVCRKATHHWLWIWIPGLPWLWHCKLLQWTCRLWMWLQLVSCICIFSKSVFRPFSSSEILIMTGISMLILVCCISDQYCGYWICFCDFCRYPDKEKQFYFFRHYLYPGEPEKVKTLQDLFCIACVGNISYVSRPHMFWMVVTGLGSRAGRVLCGVQLLFTCFSSVLGHLGNCSGKFH